MRFKGLILVGLIYGITPEAFAATVDSAATGAAGFTSVVVSSSRVARGACAHRRVTCLALNRKKTALILTENQEKAEQFAYGAGPSARAGSWPVSGARTGGSGVTSYAAAGLPTISLLGSSSPSGGGTIGGGPTGTGTTGTGSGSPTGGGAVLPTALPAVPVPAAGYLLAFGVSLLLLAHKRPTENRVRQLT